MNVEALKFLAWYTGIGTCVSVLLAPSLGAQAPDSPEAQRFYKEQVHPILKEHCLKCHGGEKIKGGLVLTNRTGLLKGGESGSPLAKDAPEKSLLLDMMSYRDADHEMPPAGKRPKQELDILEKWLAMGAPYDPALESKPMVATSEKTVPGEAPAKWWAYQPVRPLPAPPATRAEWARNPVDAFVLSALEKAGLKPNGRASKTQLIRRAYYDLTGLPPSPEEVARFEADQSADAWPRLIDSLLEKPQYGEKWARHWMDVVRYAESEGFERDSTKYHIWRYRDFLIEAFNSDLPYNTFITEQLAGDELPTPTQRSLTATGFLRLMQFDDEPADRLLAKYDLLADNVQMTSEAFLGVTMGCARCHDHKKDPITQKDYYSYMSFFHGMTDYGATRNNALMWVSPEKRDDLIREKREKLERLDSEYRKWAPVLLEWYHQNAGKTPEHAAPVLLVDAKAGVENAWKHTATDPGPSWRSENFNDQNWLTTPETKAGEGQTVWMRARFGLATVPKDLCAELEYSEQTEVFLNGAPIFQGKNLPQGRRYFELSRFAHSLHTGSNLITVKVSTQRAGALPQVRLFANKSPILIAEKLLTGPNRPELAELKRRAGSDNLGGFRATRDSWLSEAERTVGIPISAASEPGSTPPPLAVHRRGNPQNLGDPVEPAFPAIFSGGTSPAPAEVKAASAKSSGRRLALAKWLTSPENPLVSRVAVNRIWQHHFGRGIVPTSNDFGQLGERPTHPELLDYLADTFQKQGWSFKAMHRLLMNSEAYQMSAAATPEAMVKDPENRLLWRYPMRRLTAEELRDSILSVAGVLKLEMYGQPVHPPLPREVLETQSRPGAGWPVQNAADTYRRSIYVHVKRSLSVPLLSAHDQAPTDSPCAMRFVSTVPTQALGMLNSEFLAEQAALFARRLEKEAGAERESQIRRGLQLVLQRPPSAEETALCLQSTARFESELHLSKQAALERFALMALNLNEFLYLD